MTNLDENDIPPMSTPGRMELDEVYEKYRGHLDPDMPEEQARATIEALWTVMSSFVDMAWGQDPVSLAMRERDKDKA